MAFRLRRDESTTHGLRRAARKELRAAARGVGGRSPDDSAIHEARKSLKKTRAILDLIDADGGQGLGASTKSLRKVNRALSRIRDADALVQVFTTLRHRNPRLLNRAVFSRIRDRLLARKRELMQGSVRDGTWRKVTGELKKVRRRVRGWRPGHGGFGPLASGLRTTYRKSRKARLRAEADGRAEDFHRWRKQLKTLWYEMRLVEQGGPGIRRQVAILHRAEQWLGEEHNVMLLCSELSKDRFDCGGMMDLDKLRLAADRYRCSLRKKALQSTRRVYRRTPREFVRGVERVWEEWHE